MAEETDKSILTHDFIISKTQHTVHLYKDSIVWDRVTADPKKPGHTEVHFQDIIKVQEASGGDSKQQSKHGFVLHYIHRQENHVWKCVSAGFKSDSKDTCTTWMEKLQELYPEFVSSRPKKLVVYINPAAGRGKAKKMYSKYIAPIFELAGVETVVIVSEGPGHITESVQTVDLEGVDGVLVAGGDGTFTELLNGVVRRVAKKDNLDVNDPNQEYSILPIKLGALPGGSGQGMVQLSYNTKSASTAALNIVVGHSRPLDMVTIHSGGEIAAFSTLMFGFGVMSRYTELAESKRWMGPLRYLYAVKGLLSLPVFAGEVHFKMHKDAKEFPYPCPYYNPTDVGQSSSSGKMTTDGAKTSSSTECHPIDGASASDNPVDGATASSTVNADGDTALNNPPTDGATAYDDGWHVSKGPITNVDAYPFDFSQNCKTLSGVGYLNITHPTKVLPFLKVIKNQSQFKKDAYSVPFVERYQITEFKAMLKKEKNSASEDEDLYIKSMNVDGDLYKLKGDSLHWKLHPGVVDIFGADHIDWLLTHWAAASE